MPLDINGAGRSRSLACLPTARGTVAPTRGQVPGGVLLGTSTGPLKSQNPASSGLVFCRVNLGVQGPSCERISGPGGLRAERGGSAAPNFSPPQKHTKMRGLQAPPGASGPSGAFRPPRGLRLQAVCPEGSRALLHSGPSAYTNEKVLLMDLTEFS